ncbi:MAG: AraC family transcriptional regulator [Clostridiales bacterium]|jgi:AraC-like DNA-binding protein|nr:AraC family transcriptional regulator [Clostridiales bacterium]
MSVNQHTFSINQSKRGGYGLVDFARIRFENDWPSIAHMHPYCEIFIVTDGAGYHVQNKIHIPVKKGSLIIANPGVLHTETFCKNTPLEYAVFGLSNLRFDFDKEPFSPPDEAGESEQNEVRVFDLGDSFWEVEKYLAAIERELKAKAPYYEDMCRSLADLIVITVTRVTGGAGKQQAAGGAVSNSALQIADYIRNHYAANITLEFLERKFYISKFYLIRAFKKYCGATPMQFLNAVRIEKAKHLLETTNLKVADVAGAVGFYNSAYFAKLFKRATGLTPTQAMDNSGRA